MAGMKQGAEMQEGELAAWLRAQKREAREIKQSFEGHPPSLIGYSL